MRDLCWFTRQLSATRERIIRERAMARLNFYYLLVIAVIACGSIPKGEPRPRRCSAHAADFPLVD